MNIRSFLGSAALSLGLLAMPMAASAADTVLRFANFPPASTFPCVSAEHWIEDLQKATGGKIRVDHYPGGTLVDIRTMVRGVMRGQADIGCFSTAYFPGMFPLLSAFELPLGFRCSAQAGVILQKAIEKFQPAELKNFKVLYAYTCPPAQVLSRKPVKTLADMKGLRLRASGVLAEEVSLLGGSPVSMPQSEAPDAIQRGAVDGVFTSLDVVKDLNYGESCRHILLTDLSVYPFLVVMNKKTWESLPKDIQEAIDAISMQNCEWTGAYVDGHAAEALAWGKDTYQDESVSLSDEERTAALERLSPMVAAWEKDAASKGLPAAELLAFIRSML
ncbi:MAG: TRAP transporter substrate-binding protein [Mailhella sp.]|nr:TRAP transporter substrate-binding protein [Mailhella sp.]